VGGEGGSVTGGILGIPWPGPIPYAEDRARYFFGREGELAELTRLIERQRLTVLTAASAAGKTSLIRAGLIPTLALRRLRAATDLLEECEELEDDETGIDSSESLGPFPVRVGVWIGEADTSGLGFAELVRVQARQSHETMVEWMRALQSELEPDVQQGPAGQAVEQEIQRVQRSVASLVSLSCDSGSANDDILAVVDAARFGFDDVVLILDQFEEVLIDRGHGDRELQRDQALSAVERVFLTRRAGVRQLISMRDDFTNLLGPLEAREIIQGRKRFLSLSPLKSPAVTQAIGQVVQSWNLAHCDDGQAIEFDEPIVPRIVEALTDPVDDAVNLLGLQAVLNKLVEIGGGVTKGAYDAYIADPLYAEVSRNLADFALRDWIERALTKPSDRACEQQVGESGNNVPPARWQGWMEPLVKPMAADFHRLMITHAGTKKPVDREEVLEEAFGRELSSQTIGAAHFAGRVRLDGWRESLGSAEAVLQAVSKALEIVCDEVLARLTAPDAHVLKQLGTLFELTHDGLARPLREWAATFEAGPEHDLGRLLALHRENIPIGNATSEKIAELSEQGAFSGLVWRTCDVVGADLRGVVFRDCDFTRTAFVGCTFGSREGCPGGFEKGLLGGAVFCACEFKDASFRSVDLDQAVFRDALPYQVALVRSQCTVLEDVEFSQCGVSGLLLKDCILRRCGFESCELDMGHRRAGGGDGLTIVGGTIESGGDRPGLQLVDCVVPSSSIVDLKKIAGDVSIEGCLLFASQLRDLSFRPESGGGVLRVANSQLDGAILTRLTIDEESSDVADQAVFKRTGLSGSLFLECSFKGVRFQGAGLTRARGMSFGRLRADDQTTIMGRVRFVDYDLDGVTFGRVRLEGPVVFERCNALRAHFRGVSAEDHANDAVIDLSESDALYVRLLDTNSDLVLFDEQRQRPAELVDALTALEAGLRYQPSEW
jgi:uncharacterized protein YjbI with pentapeptide repeats